MSIVRTKRKKHNFTIIDNTGLIDPKLTWKETGLLAFLMTKPDDWQVSVKSLCNNKTDGRDSVSAALTGLQNKGYVYRLEKRDQGRFSTEYLVFETNEDLQDWIESDEGKAAISEQRKHRDGKAVTGKPERESRNGSTVTVNPQQVITYIDITDQQITEEVITKEEDSPSPHTIAAIAEKPPEPKSALEQIVVEPVKCKKEESIPSPVGDALRTARFANADAPIAESALEQTESVMVTIVPAKFDEPEQRELPTKMSQHELDALKQAQIYAFNPAIAPWRDAATIVNSKVQRAIFDANPNWYSTGNGSVNIKKINDRIKSLERQMRGTGAQAVEAYVELMNYVTMSQIPNSAEIIKKASGDVKQQATANNLMSMLSDRLGVQP